MFLTCFIEQKVWSLLSFWSLFSFGQLHFVGFFSHLQVFFPPFVLHSHSKNRLSIYALTNKLIQSCREKSSHQPWNLSAYCPVCFIQLLKLSHLFTYLCVHISGTYIKISNMYLLFFFFKAFNWSSWFFSILDHFLISYPEKGYQLFFRFIYLNILVLILFLILACCHVEIINCYVSLEELRRTNCWRCLKYKYLKNHWV